MGNTGTTGCVRAMVLCAVSAVGASGCYLEAQAGAYVPVSGPVASAGWSAGGSIGFHFDAARTVGMAMGAGIEPVSADVRDTTATGGTRQAGYIGGGVVSRIDVHVRNWDNGYPEGYGHRTTFVSVTGGFMGPGALSGDSGNAWMFFLGPSFGFYGFQTNGLQVSLVANYLTSYGANTGNTSMIGPQVRLRWTLGPKMVGLMLLPWR